MLASTKILLRKAQQGRYAVGHFNINNMEIMQGIVQAAVKLRSPIILATSEGSIEYAGMEYLIALARTAQHQNKIPIALHLDHGQNLSLIKKAIARGYSSIMIDASQKSFEENSKLTKQVVQWAHTKNVSVEAELGTIGGKEDAVHGGIWCTDPAQAREFVQRTGCDFLAIAIGTSHGAYKFKGKAHLRLDLLQKIQKHVKIPLILHGASSVPVSAVREAQKYGAVLSGVQGVPESQIKAAITLGICKVNTDTDLRLAFDAGIRKTIAIQPTEFDPRHILGPARDYLQKVVEHRIKLLGSAGKA